jgi:glutamate mutase epsilon subunit
MTKQEMLTRLKEAQALTTPEVTLPISFVIQMVESLEGEQQKSTKITIDKDQIKELTNLISDYIIDAGLELIDDYDLSMTYKEVEIESIDLDSEVIKKLVGETIYDWLEEVNDGDCDC